MNGQASTTAGKAANGRPSIAGKELDTLGIDWLCEALVEGRSLTDIARDVGVSRGGVDEVDCARS